MIGTICSDCGKKIIFSKDGLCKKCRLEKIEAERLEHQRLYLEALAFLSDFQKNVRVATKYTVVIASRSEESIREQIAACDAVRKGIVQWADIPLIEEAFTSLSTKQSEYHYENKCVPYTYLTSPYDESRIKEGLQKLNSDVNRIASDCYIALTKLYDYFMIFTVAGVTFSNGKRQRQNILKEIKRHTGKYREEPVLHLERYVYEGDDAVAVYANEEQIGNIPKARLPELLDKWDEYAYVDEYDIVGGGYCYYGIDIRVHFKKNNQII